MHHISSIFCRCGNKTLAKILGMALTLSLSSCATPTEHFQAVADDYGFKSATQQTSRFTHRVFLNAQALNGTEYDTLHIYLDGDGTPWEYKYRIADDPTSRRPLILDLLHLDTAPALLLGRPCYHGFSRAPGCNNTLWTSQRYSRTIVESMADALRLWLRDHPYRKLVLIGYSGGGVLAISLAPYFENTTAVLTVAANLDVDAWSRYHGYSPLNESLNPASQPALDKRIRQVHLAGKEDAIVPLPVIQAYAQRQSNSEMLVYDDYDHVCCWEDAWPAILDRLGH